MGWREDIKKKNHLGGAKKAPSIYQDQREGHLRNRWPWTDKFVLLVLLVCGIGEGYRPGVGALDCCIEACCID